MHTVAIDRLNARYRVPASAAGQKQRLDRILSEVVREILQAALERAGVPVREEICIRSVRSLTRLRLSAPDSSLAAAWSLSLAEAIRLCLGRPGADLVHYGSRHHALVDLVSGVAAGDHRRAWAWRQLGLWTIGESVAAEAAAEEAMRALTDEPQAGPAVLAAAARQGALPALLARVRPDRWRSMSRAALAAAGANPDLSATDAKATVAWSPARRAAERVLRRSEIAQAAAAVPTGLDAPRARALAVLATLEVEPESLRRDGSFATALAAAVERGLVGRALSDVEPAPDGLRHDATGGANDHGPALVRAEGHLEDPDRLPQAPSTGIDRRTPSFSTSADERARALVPVPVPEAEVTSELPAVESPLPDVRRCGQTGAAGLLFLVHVVADLALPDEIAANVQLSERPLRWVLHRLALALMPVEPDDPAALAFAGLGPDAEPPSRVEEEAREDELATVQELEARVVAALRRRLGRPEDPEPALLSELCRRRAEIVADPGWIEIRLSLDEASIEVRRAGLDLDPGWLPWLGVVMRFAYA